MQDIIIEYNILRDKSIKAKQNAKLLPCNQKWSLGVNHLTPKIFFKDTKYLI